MVMHISNSVAAFDVKAKIAPKLIIIFKYLYCLDFFHANIRDRCTAKIPELCQLQLKRKNWPQMMAEINSMVVKIGFGEVT